MTSLPDAILPESPVLGLLGAWARMLPDPVLLLLASPADHALTCAISEGSGAGPTCPCKSFADLNLTRHPENAVPPEYASVLGMRRRHADQFFHAL